VAGINRNRWPTSSGTGGRNRPEWVADFAGIRNNDQPEPYSSNEYVRNIVAEIRARSTQGNNKNVEELHQQLIDIGYKHVSIGLRIDHAEKEGKLIDAIQLCQALTQLLPDDNSKICPYLEKYAGFLSQLWHFVEAGNLFRQIHRLDPDYNFADPVEIIFRRAKILNDHHWVVEPDGGIDMIINSATAIGKKFYGRYLINKLQPINAIKAKIPANRVLEKYEKLRINSAEDSLPKAYKENVFWITRQEIEEIEIIAFENQAAQEIKGLRYVAQILDGNLNNTIIIPAVLFDWRYLDPQLSVKKENSLALKALGHIQTKKDVTNPYLAKIHSALTHALRRLITEDYPAKEF